MRDEVHHLLHQFVDARARAPEDEVETDHVVETHQAVGQDLRVERAQLAARHRRLQTLGVPAGESAVVAAVTLFVDELGLGDDAVETAVLRGEEEEGAQALALDLEAILAAAHGQREVGAQPLTERIDQLDEDGLLVREVDVERPLRHLGPADDARDAGALVALLGELGLGGLDQLLAGALAAGGQGGSRRGGGWS